MYRVKLRGALGLLVLALGVACETSQAVERSSPDVRRSATRVSPSREDFDGHPYVYPRSGRVKLFRCRWATEDPIGVYIDAPSESATQSVRLALAAWQGLGVGLRFYEVLPSEASIVIRVHESPVETASGPGTGRAVADCRVDDEETWSAALQHARVDLALNTPPDARDRVRALSDEEFTGAAVHELGHALGFQGHSKKRKSALVRDRYVSKLLGKRALAGEALSAPEVEALYQAPGGQVLEDVEVEAWRTDLIDRMARLAASEGLDGPYVRVGDTAGRVFWRAANGREYGLQIPEIEKALRRPHRFLVIPEAATRAALPRSRDLAPGSR